MLGLPFSIYYKEIGLIKEIALLQNAQAHLDSLIKQQDEQVQRTVLFALIPVVVAFSFFVFIFYRAKREALFKQREANLRLSIVESELKAIRAQINPHFIFNCMNSIHHVMHVNLKTASEYLVKFSQLIRHVLESSLHRTVPLADEIQANENYLKLEQLRMNQSFEFFIKVEEGIDPSLVHVPPMIIQPFIENSIWHGLNQVGAGGKIEIFFSEMDDNHIQCVIKDNGRDGSKSEIDLSHRVKKVSVGLSLIQERLNVLNSASDGHVKAGFRISPNPDGQPGKCCVITIPFED